MIASATEALLALCCLIYQKDVEGSVFFKDLNKGPDYESRVLRSTFETYINLASVLEWVPSSAVGTEVLKAALQDFPIVATNLYPNQTPTERDERAKAFQLKPGIEMLRILQYMRNLVHGPRWPRFGIKVGSVDFESDCKFVFVIGYQVMMCLLESFAQKSGVEIAETEQLLAALDPLERAFLLKEVLNALEK